MAFYKKVGEIDECVANYYRLKDPNVGLGVVIKNSSTFDLEYVNSGVVTGFNITPVVDMFSKKDEKIVIEPGHAGGLMWDRNAGGEFGGYFETRNTLILISKPSQ